MKQVFVTILENYLKEIKKPFSGNELGKFVRKKAKEEIERSACIDSEKYLVYGSVGQGNWAEIPWIAIFDKDITTTATKGYYIVYLFRADMSGVYLSLNQGWTYFRENYGDKNGKEKIKMISQWWRVKLSSALDDFDINEIDLHCTGTLGKGYELGHICGKFYPANQIPDSSVLIDDLRNLLGVYRELKGHFRGKKFFEVNDEILNRQFIETNDYLDPNDKSFQQLVERSEASVTPEKPIEKPKKKVKDTETYIRDPKIAKEAIQKAQFCCELDPNHKTFISNVTGQNFVEAHHLIPLSMQEEFEYSLDVPGNIVSLCPNCHRAIHLAVPEQKREILEKLFNIRKEKLLLYGIKISKDKLFKIYGC